MIMRLRLSEELTQLHNKLVNDMEKTIEKMCPGLLARQKPLTHDLITDCKHICDHATNIAGWTIYNVTG